MNTVVLQHVDGVLRVRLPEGVTAKDFENWMNKTDDKPELTFVSLPEKWTSADDRDDDWWH